MVTLAQRIEALRTERGLSRAALAAALSLPKFSIEKFETGRQSPNKEQVQQLADFFNVSTFYLKGESNDRTRQDTWLEGEFPDDGGKHVPLPGPKRKAPPQPKPQPPMSGGGTVLDSFLRSRQFKDVVRDTVWEVLSSPAGQELIAKAVRRELDRKG